MGDLKGFTRLILGDISQRLGGTNRIAHVKMTSLESLVKVHKKEIMASAPRAAAAFTGGKNSGEKKLILESDIAGMEPAGELWLSQGDIVTPLAMDMVRSKKIRIKREAL